MKTRAALVIVGGGLAGAKAAAAARGSGYEGRITLIGDELAAPYERPPLSKAILRGDAEPATAAVHADNFYLANHIDLITGIAVVEVDVGRRRVVLSDGSAVAYSTAVLATGAAPRRLAVPGAGHDNVLSLRTIADAARLSDAVSTGTRVAVIGAGWIGTEVAASLRQMGAEVVLVGRGTVPLQSVLGPVIGDVFRRIHTDHGVVLRLDTSVTALRGRRAVEAIELSDGSVEPVDLVVAGIGATPNVHLAHRAGIDVKDGIVVNEHLESSAPGVFAAGDVASAFHPWYGEHVRVEHWANALNQGETAGRNATGPRAVYARLPYFYSDQYDIGLEHVGRAGPGDSLIIRGDLEAREFVAFWQSDGAVTAAMAMNVWDVVVDLKALITGGPVDVVRLADPGVPLHEVASAATSAA